MSNERELAFDAYDKEFADFLGHVEKQEAIVPDDKAWVLSLPAEVRGLVLSFPPNTIVNRADGTGLWGIGTISGVVQSYGLVWSKRPAVGVLPIKADRSNVMFHDRGGMVYILPEDLMVVRHLGPWTPEVSRDILAMTCELCRGTEGRLCRSCGIVCARCHSMIVANHRSGHAAA